MTSGACWWSSPCARSLASSSARLRQKRGGGHLVGESALVGAGASEAGGLDRLAGHEPGPELAALVVDEYRRLRDSLRS